MINKTIKSFLVLLLILFNFNFINGEDEFEEFSNNDLQKIEIIDNNNGDINLDKKYNNKTTINELIFKDNIIYIFLAIILGFLSFYFKKVRYIRYIMLLISLAFLGFYVGGCNCSVGAFMKFFYALFTDQKGILVFSMLVFVPIILTFFFGRIFCGYVCPIGALQEFVARRDKIIKISYKWEKKLKHLRIVFFILIISISLIKQEFIFSEVSPFKTIFNVNGTILQVIFASLILLISLFIYRPFCRFLCPLSLALEVTGRFSIFKIKKDKEFCCNCKSCEKKCPVNAIDSEKNIDNGACIRCGECLDCCKKS